MMCQHCGRRRASRPRQLCWDCYYTPGVRERYPIISKFHQRGSAAVGRCTGPATFPTSALPGSLAKILVLRRRAELRQELFHPDDATVYGPRPLAQAS